MTNSALEINAFIEQTKKFAEPMSRFSSLSAEAFSRFARFGFDVAGDALQASLAALQATAESREPTEFLKKQAALTQSFVERQTQRSQDLLKLAGETRSHFSQWMDEAQSNFSKRTAPVDAAA
jgi:Phasin protein